MTRRFGTTLVASFVLALAAGPLATAHPDHEHKVFGTVTMAASDHVMLDDKDGKETTIFITNDTKVLKDKDKKTMKAEDIKTGMRVVVTAVMEEEKMMAKTIELGAAPEAN